MLSVSLFLSTSLVPHAEADTEATEDSWTTMEPMPTPRSAGVAVVDGKIYAIGGTNGSLLGTNEMYDPITDTWTTKQSMPTARHGFAIAVYQNKIYVIGGIFGESDFDNSGYTGVNEVYDPLTDTWETMEPMPTARAGLDANVVGDKMYLIGGSKYTVIWPHSQSTDGVNEVYDPSTDSWSTKTSAAPNVPSYPSVVVDNKIYLMGSTFLSHVPTQIYDPETDTWSQGEPIPAAIHHGVAGATTGALAPRRIYVLGGYNSSPYDPSSLNHVYDPERNVWSTGTPMPTARYGLSVAVVNDTLYAIGGTNVENTFAVNEKYTPIGYIPEFPSWVILPLFVTATLAVIIYRKKLKRAT